MPVQIDIYLLLLSLAGVLLTAILIALLILIGRSNKKTADGELGLLQNEILNLRNSMDHRLSESQKLAHENLQKTFQSSTVIANTSNKNIESITRKLTEMGETNKQIQDIAGRLEGLENILKNPKRRGNLWEYFLKELLENVFSPDQFSLQYTLWNIGIIDAALFVGGKIVPIDAKFPQENYEKLIKADDSFAVKSFSKQLSKDIKLRIDEVQKYILPEENTTDFAFMLIPAEGLYYDIFISNVGELNSRELIEYGFSKKVIICSPSGFYAYLQTVMQGLKALKIEEQAKEIQKYVLKLQKDLASYEEIFWKIWNSLGTTVNHYNAASKRLKIIDKDIIKIDPEAQELLWIGEEIEQPIG